jgi:hypothetical protein
MILMGKMSFNHLINITWRLQIVKHSLPHDTFAAVQMLLPMKANVKSKVIKFRGTAPGRLGRVAPLILILGAELRWAIILTWRFTPKGPSDTRRIWDWVLPRTCLDVVKKSLALPWNRTPVPRSSSPYPSRCTYWAITFLSSCQVGLCTKSLNRIASMR